MADKDERDDDRQEGKDEGATRTEESSGGGEGQTAWDEYAAEKKCPECDEPVIDVRANCPKCGYEYKDDDFGDQEAGKEFLAGSAVTDEGEEVPDHESGTGEDGTDDSGEQADEEEASEDTSDDTSDDTSEGTSEDTSGDED